MKLTPKQIEARIKKAYPHGTDLIYIDYRDNFDNNKDLMEELANTGFMDNLTENMDFWDSEHEAINHIIEENFDEDERKQIDEDKDLRQAVVDICQDLDTSHPLRDMLKNTARRFFYYDLDYKVEAQGSREFMNDCDYNNEEELARGVAKRLRISYSKYKEELDELVANAWYGGDLVILFVADPSDLYAEKPNFIKFNSGFEVCIMDRGQGSGHSVKIDRDFTFQFLRENLHDDIGNNGYSFSNEVCGLCKWDETDFEWLKKANNKVIEVATNEQAKAIVDRDKQYQKTYNEGGCTFGDMKYSRHRDTEYINNYPCGNKCKICGTFWID